MKWQQFGNVFFQANEGKLIDKPGKGIYQVVTEMTAGSINFGLQYLSDKFEFKFKIYDLGIGDISERVVNTWYSGFFRERNKNLGVIYNGKKGTGKTIAAKLLCNELSELPVIIIPEYYKGLQNFLQSLNFECIIFIDEAEKIFPEDNEEASSALLRSIDGILSGSRKLFILTTNELNINDNLINRPSRIRYIKEFNGISDKAIKEIIEDKLINKDLKDKVFSEIKKLTFITIDVIENIIDEFNIHENLIEGDIFNIPTKDFRYKVLNLKFFDNSMDALITLDDVINLSKTIKNIKGLTSVYAPINNHIDSKDYEDLGLLEDNSCVRDYIYKWVYKNIKKSESSIDTYRSDVDIDYFATWSTALFPGIESTESYTKIKNIKNGCIEFINDNGETYFGILLQ